MSFGETVERYCGAIPSDPHKAFAAAPHVAEAYPPNFGVPCPKYDYWLNDSTGICVSAEEAAAKDRDGVWIDPSTLGKWARQHGYYNGANLTDVMDTMSSVGILGADGKTYHDGPYTSVDWTNKDVLCSAIASGQVKIGVSGGRSSQLQSKVFNRGIRFATGFTRESRTDHCVGLPGYGTAQYYADAFKVSVPAGLDPNTFGLWLFTWSEVIWIDHPSLNAITTEAWLRTPTTPEATPPTPPGPGPCPLPDPSL